MKLTAGAPWNISDEKARTELNRFLIAGWACSLIAVVAFGWLCYFGLIVSGRCIVLSWQKGNAERSHGRWLKAASIGLLVFSFGEFILIQMARS